MRLHIGISLAVSLVLSGEAARVAQSQPTVIDPGQGSVVLSSGATAAAELSGITHAGGTIYQAVGDNGAATIWTLDRP
jgi:hypothetical protein